MKRLRLYRNPACTGWHVHPSHHKSMQCSCVRSGTTRLTESSRRITIDIDDFLKAWRSAKKKRDLKCEQLRIIQHKPGINTYVGFDRICITCADAVAEYMRLQRKDQHTKQTQLP